MISYRRILVAILAIALLAAAYVAARRVSLESQSRTVEVAMDYGDIAALARSYNYDLTNVLVSLRRAGLTSLAVSEELGGGVNTSQNAIVQPGQALIDQSRLTRIGDPVLAGLVASHAIRGDETYLVVYDPLTARRYRTQLAIHFGARGWRVLHAGSPTVFAIRTQSDYFANVGLGIPDDQLALVRKLHLLLIPRLQNDERLGAPQIQAMFAAALPHERVHTVIFFGLRNAVLGFPDAIDATAAELGGHHAKSDALRLPIHRSTVGETRPAARNRQLVFGSIEAYDVNQIQKGTDQLARAVPGLTTRVEAISKVELDKLSPETIVARYLLGVRERNVRVVYLRPYLHQLGGRSIAATNVELVRRIADGLHDRGFRLGPATPVPPFRVNPLIIAIITLAVPALTLLLLDLYGWSDRRFALLFAADLLLYAGAYALHHELLARKLIALIGAIAFPVAAFIALAPAFRRRAPEGYREAFFSGLRVTAIATVIALGGALVVIGLLSTPLMMEEIDRFSGVKAVLLLPPILVLTVYVFSDRFGARVGDPGAAVSAPVRVYQLLGGAILLGLAYIVLVRSGNQSDIAPSAFELALRSKLTAALSVRPRFKEFVVGFPALMLLPALRTIDRRRAGWLIALAIGIGLGDVVDTFSHLHTALGISLLRVINGAVIGILIGALAIWAYRALVFRFRPAIGDREVRRAPDQRRRAVTERPATASPET